MTLVQIKNVRKYFTSKHGLVSFGERKVLRAVDGVSIDIPDGTTVGLAGESGSGKTTLGKLVVRLYEPDDGQILFDGVDILKLDSGRMKQIRPQMQMVFQNPFASLNPRRTIRKIVTDPLKIYGIKDKVKLESAAEELLAKVGLEPARDFLNRYPHELSGGQRQRVAIARAIATHPRLVIADEAVSSLDVSVKAQILVLLKDLQKNLGVSFLFISHDLAVLRSIADTTYVMYLGKIVESGKTGEIFDHPRHPYTEALLSATFVPDPKRAKERKKVVLKGDIPSAMMLPSGCRFRTRCLYAKEKCSEVEPPLLEVDGRSYACHFPL